MAVSRKPAKTDEERRERYLAAHRRHNNSSAGRERKKRYREAVARAKGPTPKAKDGLERLSEMIS